MLLDQITPQTLAARRVHADPRFREIQEYCNLEFRREELAWLVAQARETRETTPGRPSGAGTFVARIRRFFGPSSSSEPAGGSSDLEGVEGLGREPV